MPPRHSYGLGLLGIGVGVVIGLGALWLGQHPLLQCVAFAFGFICIVTGAGCFLPPSFFRFPFGFVPLHAAARHGYEAEERAGLDGVTGTHYSSPEVGLDHYKHVFLSARIPLYGARPPSTARRLIPLDEYDEISPVAGASALATIADQGRGRTPRYVDVVLRRSEMNRAIKDYLATMRRNPAR